MDILGAGGRSVNVESNRIKLQATLISNIAYSCFALKELYLTRTVGTIHANNILLRNESTGHSFFDSAKEEKNSPEI